MGIRTRLRVPANVQADSSGSGALAITETSIRLPQPRNENKQAQVHLSHGRGLYQVHEPSQGPEPTLPEGEAVVEAAPFEPLASPSKHAMKREKLLNRWKRQISQSIEPYLELQRASDSLRLLSPLRIRTSACECCHYTRQLTIDVVRFNKFESVTLWASDCESAANQLIRSGLFPCSPVHPTLAVDVRMLDFVTRLFLRVAPNHTAWCGAVEDYLRCQGYKLQGKDPLRRRFGNALCWFNSLQHATEQRVKSLLDHTRADLKNFSDTRDPNSISGARRASVEEVEDEDASTRRRPQNAEVDIEFTDIDASVGQSSRKRCHNSEEEFDGRQGSIPLDRPSEYLRSRCPVCFGGNFNPENKRLTWSDVLVCLDANFTQRHQSSRRDPARSHPDSFFLNDEEVEEVQARVEATRERNDPPAKKAKTDTHNHNEDDHMEPGMRVSKAVLDLCGGSFTAAHEYLAKVVSAGYDVTGLMALLCRHDRPLFVVNMTTPGERQHYAIALLEKLFKHLPSYVEVGLLYDIGCQLERSCLKWGFLDKYMDRMTFAISVFHAFGHQWPCQIVYNPRKCVGFGLSDGEGAERLWSSIQRLIAYTRVAGYHLRIYTLDAQFHFGNHESLLKMGSWIQRKLQSCQEKQSENSKILAECGREVAFLRDQWKHQVYVQTKPLPSQHKNKGKQSVEECLKLRRAQKVLYKRMKKLEDTIADTDAAPYEVAAAQLDLPKTVDDYNRTTDKLRRKEKALGVTEKTQLHRLVNDHYVHKRMNAHALLFRLRHRLQSRKFELDRLERCYHKKRSDQRLKDHTSDSVKRREPGIQQLAFKYNKLVKEMRDLITVKKAPRNAIAPECIDTKNLFDLDVDDVIWQDIGLTDDDDSHGLPPPWLADENTRKGIQAMLEVDRCDEEDERLAVEMKSLQEWFIEEWEVLMKTMEKIEDEPTHFQLELRRRYLCRLCVLWQDALEGYAEYWDKTWGPSEKELVELREWEASATTDSLDEGDYDLEFEAEVDPVLTEQEETVAYADAYRTVEEEDVE
ncbi:hypothetical protein VKT23_009474 [Stygiomarasmius scandens]|uniref:CxC1-like cysteine cluster associated with KDZ transposases domain-containing protein n=1 Tax=Marasmiellus scandens TaxID=2682957 RepID=A0ABR1JG91_9AGAR